MILTASKIPLPEPIAPMKSAKIVNKPTHIPPTAAAVGIYLFKTDIFKLIKLIIYHRRISLSCKAHVLIPKSLYLIFGTFS